MTQDVFDRTYPLFRIQQALRQPDWRQRLPELVRLLADEAQAQRSADARLRGRIDAAERTARRLLALTVVMAAALAFFVLATLLQ